MPDIKATLTVIFQILIYAGIIQGLYSSFILTHTNRQNPANNFLAVLLIILSVSIIHSIFIVPYFLRFHNTTFQIKEPFILLAVPLLWFYVKKLNEPTFKLKIKHLLHLLPFISEMIFNVLFLTHQHANNKEFYQAHTQTVNIVIYVVAVGQYVFYLYYILKLLRVFKSKALNELSNTENIDPAWLRIFLFTFLAVFILSLIMMVIAIHRLRFEYFNNIVSLVFAFTIYILGYKGLYQQTILHIDENVATSDSGSFEKISTETKIDEQLLQKLLDFMIEHKPYHDPELTLTSLAGQIEIGRNQLSEIINAGTGGNFYDFVNRYRVEEVRQLMNNQKFKDFTILAIAFEAGFPSKSTFNSIFKKFTGLTPSEYRNRLS